MGGNEPGVLHPPAFLHLRENLGGPLGCPWKRVLNVNIIFPLSILDYISFTSLTQQICVERLPLTEPGARQWDVVSKRHGSTLWSLQS